MQRLQKANTKYISPLIFSWFGFMFQNKEAGEDPPIDSAVDIDNEEQVANGREKSLRFGDDG